MATDGKFNQKERSAFAPGGSLSTPKQRESVPADHFLDQKNRKYPYKIGGKISCDMLRAAMSRSMQNGETAIHAEAKRLFDSHCDV